MWLSISIQKCSMFLSSSVIFGCDTCPPKKARGFTRTKETQGITLLQASSLFSLTSLGPHPPPHLPSYRRFILRHASQLKFITVKHFLSHRRNIPCSLSQFLVGTGAMLAAVTKGSQCFRTINVSFFLTRRLQLASWLSGSHLMVQGPGFVLCPCRW